jgi:DNA-binding protein YbaB
MDMEALMAQAAELQNKVSAAQEYLGKTVVKGVAANGACIVDMTGKYDLVKMTVTPELLTHGADVVADVISVAYRDAKNKADELVDKVMGQATSGINLPN